MGAYNSCGNTYSFVFPPNYYPIYILHIKTELIYEIIAEIGDSTYFEKLNACKNIRERKSPSFVLHTPMPICGLLFSSSL